MIQLHIRNIGPIDTIDLNIDSDLTFIYGKNNIGKSYATTILYLVLKNFAFEFPYVSRYSYGYFPRMSFADNTIVKEIEDKLESDDEFDITENINRYFSNLIKAIFTEGLENSFRNSFGDISNLHNKISNQPLEIILELGGFNIHIGEENNKLTTTFASKSRKYICRKIHRHWRPRQENENTILYYNKDDNNKKRQLLGDIQAHFNELYRNSAMSIITKINSVYYLPASRSGLYRALNAFSQILVELARKRSFLQGKIVLPNISEQDSDYFSKINEINTKRINQKFSSVAADIETQLLKGSVLFDQTTKQILFHPNNIDISLELLGTSSMIAEVSPIVLFLRYIIGSEEDVRRRKDDTSVPVIFIEEPEAHLHPEAQVSLIGCFVDMVKKGAKLVITSHSNYIFDQLNNLIAEKKIDKDKIKGILLAQGEKGSYSKSIPISDLGMEDDNFIEVSENLYNEKINIIDKMEVQNAE